MVELKNDRKTRRMWTITVTDSEGFHRQINMTKNELDELTSRWLKLRAV